jgi:predicted DNA-binding transcriptional regulator AlpA
MRLIVFEQLEPSKGIPYSRDHLRRLVKGGQFPKPIALSSARIAWDEAEIDECLEQKAAERNDG